MRMEGRRVLLTAATGETGAAIVLLLAQEGARLALTSRHPENLESLVARIRDQGSASVAIGADPTDEASMSSAATRAAEAFGGLDGVVYNVGGFVSGDIRSADTATADWERMLRQHVYGAFFTLRVAVPYLVRAGGGSAIVIGAAEGARQRGNVAYAVAKGALIPLVHKVARDYRAEGVRVNLVQPRSINEAPVRSPVQPRIGPLTESPVPEDIAYACLYLLSAESRMVTGQVLNVDGGRDL